MALYLREFHNKDITVTFEKKEIEEETGQEIDKSITFPINLDMSSVSPKVTVFNVINKVMARVSEEPMEIINVFQELGIVIKTKAKQVEGEGSIPQKYVQTFPRITGKASSYQDVARDMFLCNRVFETIKEQYIADDTKLSDSLYKEFENFQ